METRSSKRKSSATNDSDIQDENSTKKQRVVLGEISNSSNVSDSQISNPDLSGRVRNSMIKRVAASKKTLSSLDSDLDTQNEESQSFTEKPITNDKFSDPQNCETFVDEIDSYLFTMERKIKRTPISNYLERVQRNVTPHMRGILVDWMVEVAEEYNLLPDTLFLSVSHVDMFLSLNRVSKPKLQLLGVSAMLIASKYEEMTPPSVEDFVTITNNTYEKSEVVKMEANILKSLRFELGNPTAKSFVRRFMGIGCENIKAQKLKFEYLCNYLIELSLLEYSCLKFLPSLVAASAIFLARYITWPKLHPWPATLYKFTGYNVSELKECVLILNDLHLEKRGESYPAIREKYKQHKFKNVAHIPSPPQLPSSIFEDE